MNRKLVVFVPADALDIVRDALFAAGAGRIGDYERCSWYAEGTGTFRPLPGANPAIGEVGEEERVPELRLEQLDTADDLEGELVLRFEESDGIAKTARLTGNGVDVELFHILTYT